MNQVYSIILYIIVLRETVMQGFYFLLILVTKLNYHKKILKLIVLLPIRIFRNFEEAGLEFVRYIYSLRYKKYNWCSSKFIDFIFYIWIL